MLEFFAACKSERCHCTALHYRVCHCCMYLNPSFHLFRRHSTMTMRAALCTDFGDVDEMLSVVPDAPRPAFDPAAKAARGRALVRVQATALAPGDVRVLSGRTRAVQGPPSLPYVAGGTDLCG